ncbi:MAG: Gfo/Idh/MocA family oxidoreductase [Planctomycetes bacterium]|nr:Gfo/Idh/MocA family oxidoreductase [Planctomycetota bacterium]
MRTTPRRTATRLSRRRFLRAASAAAGAIALPAIAPRGLLGENAPSHKVVLGLIGMGEHGVNRNLSMLLAQPDAEVAAVCDVFASRRDTARSIVETKYSKGGCGAYTDFRRIIDRKDIDAVMISTPDHWHVLMSVLAVRAGKDVICEKPTLTIREGRVLCEAVKRHKAVYQTSTEDRSLPCYHAMAQVVRNGLIGKVATVRVQLPAGERYPNEAPAPVPEGLDYDLWLGPAREAPYTPSRTERQHWRNCRDYSGGKLTDWGMHQLDTVQWALDVERTGPVEVEGKGTVNAGSTYDTFIDYDVTYRYSSGVEVHVRSGGTGLRFEGEKGWVGNPSFAAPLEASSKEVLAWKPGERDLKLYTNPAGEHRDFLDCVRSRKEPYFPSEVGHRCSTLCHLGNIAMRLGRKLRWDPAKEAFEGDAEADGLRSRPMRAPWTLEG